MSGRARQSIHVERARHDGVGRDRHRRWRRRRTTGQESGSGDGWRGRAATPPRAPSSRRACPRTPAGHSPSSAEASPPSSRAAAPFASVLHARTSAAASPSDALRCLGCRIRCRRKSTGSRRPCQRATVDRRSAAGAENGTRSARRLGSGHAPVRDAAQASVLYQSSCVSSGSPGYANRSSPPSVQPMRA